MKTLNFSLFFLIFILSCKSDQDYYPIKNKDVSQIKHDIHTTDLSNAYKKNDYFLIGYQMANLKAPSDKVYKNLKKGINQDTSNCIEIFLVRRLAIEGFQKTIYKSDSLQFMECFQLCNEIYRTNYFKDYYAAYLDKVKLKIEGIDSSGFNMELVQILIEIEKDDQTLLKKLAKKKENGESLTKIETMQLQSIDSINLYRVDSILTSSGYPTVEEVGSDLSLVVWLVLQHQTDLEIRNKYRHYIEEFGSEGQLEIFDLRSSYIDPN